MVGHKWALVCKSPKGHETSTTGDRFCRALMFTIFGFVLLLLSVLVDQVWFILHIYKMDLDKTYYFKASQNETPEIHRRTYKKLFEYFKKGNEQLVLQKEVVIQLRDFLDVEEGLRAKLFGPPTEIYASMEGFYKAYADEHGEF
jgi:hypothetical protein